MKKVEIFSGNWTNIDVMKSSNKFFVFGDNCERWGKGGQAIIRDLKNTIGLRTKKKPDNLSSSFFNDLQYEDNCKIILQDILTIKEKNLLDIDIVLSKNGYGTGLARMSEKSPETFNYLNSCLINFLHFDNKLGVTYYRLPSGTEIANGDYVDLTKVSSPNDNSFLLEDSLRNDIYNIYDQILNQKKISITSDYSYKENQIINFYYPGKKPYLVCKVIHDSIKVSDVDSKTLSTFEGYHPNFIKKYDNNKLVTFIEFICTLDDNGNVVYNNDYFSNDIILPKEDIVEYQSESSLSEKIDSLHKKVDLILDYLTKKL